MNEESAVKPYWRGFWQNDSGIRYVVGDNIYRGNGYYKCTCDHWAEENTEPGIGEYWGSYWSYLGGVGDGFIDGGSDPWELVKELEARVVTTNDRNGKLWKEIRGLKRGIVGLRQRLAACIEERERAVPAVLDLHNEFAPEPAEEESARKLYWRGLWQDDCNVFYKVGDCVDHLGNFYRCICDHWAEHDTRPERGDFWLDYWVDASESGKVVGEDVSSTPPRYDAVFNEAMSTLNSDGVPRIVGPHYCAQCRRQVYHYIDDTYENYPPKPVMDDAQLVTYSDGHITGFHQYDHVLTEEEIAEEYASDEEIGDWPDEPVVNELMNRIEDIQQYNEQLQTDNHALDESNTLYRKKAVWWKGEAERRLAEIVRVNEMVLEYKEENRLLREEDKNLSRLYKRYRETAHRLYASLNEIAGEIKFERERIAITHTAEEWQEHLPEGYIYIEESVPFTEEDWDKVAEMAKITPVISDEEPIDMDDVEGSIEAAVQHYIDELNDADIQDYIKELDDAEEAAEKEG